MTPPLIAAPCCDPARPFKCPKCGVVAVLPLDAASLAEQPDATTHVCHPLLGGCNHGFERTVILRNAATGEVVAELPARAWPKFGEDWR